MPIANVNHANLYYESHGAGEPVILIAGYACDHLIWMPILNGLCQYFNVIIFDNRGSGQTVDENVPLSPKLLAEDVVALADYLGFKKPHLVGKSMGGTIVQTIASAYPEKIGKLAILTSSAKWRRAALSGLKSLLDMREKNIDFDCLFAATLPWIVGESFFKNSDHIDLFKKNILTNPFPQSLSDQIRQFKILEDFDGIADLKKIQSPTLIAYGIEDLISLPEESEIMASEIPQAKLIQFRCAHGITLEQPQQLTHELITFLKE